MCKEAACYERDFYPRPPRGGRPGNGLPPVYAFYFYPRPPRGGRPPYNGSMFTKSFISIHALREEGDLEMVPDDTAGNIISIHALREEGDRDLYRFIADFGVFLSTPSARRATHGPVSFSPINRLFLSTPSARRATNAVLSPLLILVDFYPRPPRGGRRGQCTGCRLRKHFYPRPPRGGRLWQQGYIQLTNDFYPRPPRGGRPVRMAGGLPIGYFYPRPPRGGRRMCA